MRFINCTLGMLAALVLSVSCHKEAGEDAAVPSGGQIHISATLSDCLTKVSFTPGDDGSGSPVLNLAWAEGDKVRVYNHEDRTLYKDYTLDPSCIGQKQGTFTGEPFSASSYDIEILEDACDYAGQAQPADGVTSDLKYYASVSGASSYENIQFTQFSSVLAICAKLPADAADGVKSVDISASENIFNNGDKITITLASPGDEGDDDVLVLYATLPVGTQAIPAGTSMIIRFNAPGTSHTVYTRYLELGSGLSFTAGRLNYIKVNCSRSDTHAGMLSDAGTEDSPYLIGDKYQMNAVHDLLAAGEMKHFKMIDDVDMSGINWTPLNTASPYTKYISFDGNGKTVTGFTSSGAYASMFGVLNGQIKNLTVDGAVITPATSTDAGVIACWLGYQGNQAVSVDNVTISNSRVGNSDFNGVCGVLAAKLRKSDTIVKNVTVSGSTASSLNNYVGGLIGYVYETSSISGCTVSGCTISGKSAVGGLVGQLGSSSTSGTCSFCFVDDTTVSGSYRNVGGLFGLHYGALVSRCGAESTVTVSSPSYHVGGISGYQQYNNLENSYSRAGVSGSSCVGVLVGEMASPSQVSKCYGAGTAVSSTANSAAGLVGVIGSGTSVSKSISWDSVLPLAYSINGTLADDCYTKAASESGTVSSHARESVRSWSDAVWDFSTDFPTLKDSYTPEEPEPELVINVIPYPNSVTLGEGSFSVSGAPVYYDETIDQGSSISAVGQFAERLGVSAGTTSGSGEASGFNFLKDDSLAEEEYTLDVTADKVVVKASSRAGIFYAIQTIKQLLPAEFFDNSSATDGWTIPCLSIADKPRFPWRGMHLDVSRHFFTVDEIKEYLDIMALYKLNRFHWHLSDDQGWRIEIPGDEALTRIGAYRGDNHPVYPGYNRDNGFYTVSQVKEIVKYAHDRCIIVMPEIDLPGHAASLLAAHPELACSSTTSFVVWTGFGINTDLLCVDAATGGDTKDILENIVKQLADMFPESEYIHFGGDETRTGSSYSNSWKSCSHCLALMNSLGLTDAGSITKETRLQYYFTKYMCGLVGRYGKKLMGWQEIYANIKDSEDFNVDDLPGVCVESWTQAGHAVNAAKAGLKGIAAPSYSHYLSYPQEQGSDRAVTLENCYTLTFNSANLGNGTEDRILGTEGCMWTESITSLEQLEYMLLPRLGAISEVSWTEVANKDFSRLKESIRSKHFAIYEAKAYDYCHTID